MLATIKLFTKNTEDGKPRRLYLVYNLPEGTNGAGMERIDIIEENWNGFGAVTGWYGNDVVLLQEIEVSIPVYRHWVKVGQEDRRLREEQ